MTSPAPFLRARGRRRATLWPLSALAMVAAIFASQSGAKLAIVNESPSLPKGLYLRAFLAQPSPGAIVALSPPAPARAYLQEIGMPAGTLLLKRVAAGEGDLACRGKDHLDVAGRSLAVARLDSAGRPLPAWKGCARLQPEEVFLLGDTPASFDSRYFGPVATGGLTGVYRTALTW